jgi:hypothetical protein
MSFLIDIGNLLIVLSACGLSLIVPPLGAALWFSEDKSWPNILLLALVLGLSTQGVFGFFGNHFLRTGITLEITIYFLGWLIATAIILISQRKQKLFQRLSISREDFVLVGLLVLAIAVRSIHPLQHMALGQSDAYSHLQFLRDVLDSGFIQNVMYPPGYHWILALPTAAFHLDPYLVARYGGAFFGAGLVLAVYVLVKSIAGNPAAIFSAFLVSCFPGLNLLLKTGVGAFANQLGLFFIPVVFYFYIVSEEKTFGKSPMAYTLLALSLMGLSISVPMMLIHVLLILFMVRMSQLIKRRDKWFFQTGIFALSILPALILLSLHLLHAGPVHQKKTIEVITAGASINSVPSSPGETSEGVSQFPLPYPTRHLKTVLNHPAMNLLFDFFSVKRCGVGHFAVNTIGFLILIISGISILWGFRGGGMDLAPPRAGQGGGHRIAANHDRFSSVFRIPAGRVEFNDRRSMPFRHHRGNNILLGQAVGHLQGCCYYCRFVIDLRFIHLSTGSRTQGELRRRRNHSSCQGYLIPSQRDPLLVYRRKTARKYLKISVYFFSSPASYHHDQKNDGLGR